MADDQVPRALAKRLVCALCNYGGWKGEQAARRIAPELLAEVEADDNRRDAALLRAEADLLDPPRPSEEPTP